MRLFSRREDARSTRTPAQDPSAGGDITDVLRLSRERVTGVVEAATAAASDIRRASSKHAETADLEHRINRERVVSDLLQALVERTEELKRDAEGLARLLDRASSRLADEPRISSPVAGPQPPATPALAPPSAASEKPMPFQPREKAPPRPLPPKPGPTGEADATAVRLLATQMVVAGSSRAEVSARLQREFGVEDTDVVLDDLFAEAG